MLVSNWAQNYWAVSTVAKQTLYDYKNVYGSLAVPFVGSKDLDGATLIAIQGFVIASPPYQSRLALIIIKALGGEAKFSGMTEKIQPQGQRQLKLTD